MSAKSGQNSADPPKTVLVIGATGQQGRAVVSTLFSRTNFRILGLTRNPSAESSKALLSLRRTIEPTEASLELVQGDLDEPNTIRQIFETESGKGAITAVFVVLAFPGLGANADKEEMQGIVSLLQICFWTVNSSFSFLFFFFCGPQIAVSRSCP